MERRSEHGFVEIGSPNLSCPWGLADALSCVGNGSPSNVGSMAERHYGRLGRSCYRGKIVAEPSSIRQGEPKDIVLVVATTTTSRSVFLLAWVGGKLWLTLSPGQRTLKGLTARPVQPPLSPGGFFAQWVWQACGSAPLGGVSDQVVRSDTTEWHW